MKKLLFTIAILALSLVAFAADSVPTLQWVKTIGGSGANSVASATAAPFTRVGHHISAATYGYWSGLATDGYEWYFHANACCGVIPTNSGQACVFACALPER